MSDTWWVRTEQLDEDQRNVVSLPINKDFLITGPPGSGKTNLLLLRANYFVLTDKPNLLILTFTRTLRQFVVAGAANYEFDGSRIMTFVSWMQSLLKDEGIESSKEENFDLLRYELVTQCQALVSRKGYGQRYDAILVDEAQDCLPEEIDLARSLARVLFCVADDNQRIYTNKGGYSRVLDYIGPSQRFNLDFHYRNGISICHLADEILRPAEGKKMQPASQYDEQDNPSSVSVFVLGTVEQQLKKVEELIKLQRAAYPDEMIGVLCPLRGTLLAVADWFKKSELADECVIQTRTGNGYLPFTDDKHICICTVHSAKGLEFRAVHIISTEEISKFRQQQIQLAYTAVTRAKTSLSIYHNEPLPHFLQSALHALKLEKPKLPDISSLFRGRL